VNNRKGGRDRCRLRKRRSGHPALVNDN
jgi:hypothetical protein